MAGSLGEEVWWYQAPEVTERLKIQRGSFLLGPLSALNSRRDTSLPLHLGSAEEAKAKDDSNWLWKRMDRRGQPGNVTRPRADVFKIVIRGGTKKYLRALLEERSGLSVEAVYPTPWHRPFIEQFSTSYGRLRDLALDLGNDPGGPSGIFDLTSGLADEGVETGGNLVESSRIPTDDERND